MSDLTTNLTTTQKGSVTEYAVATALMLGSGGRLSVFSPLADDHGVDLILYDKPTGVMTPVQVKSWMGRPSASGRVQFDVQKTTFSEKAGLLLIAVLFDAAKASIEMSWLMSMADVAETAVSQKTKFALTPSMRPATSDRYRPYRHDDHLPSLVTALISRIEATD